MSFLIDTHALLWFFAGSEELSGRARSLILNPQNRINIIIASIWEIGIKVSLGKLRLGFRMEELKLKLEENQIDILPIDFDHIAGLQYLEDVHKDPFDRILICQARIQQLGIISKDSHFKSYLNVQAYW